MRSYLGLIVFVPCFALGIGCRWLCWCLTFVMNWHLRLTAPGLVLFMQVYRFRLWLTWLGVLARTNRLTADIVWTALTLQFMAAMSDALGDDQVGHEGQ
jgi:hypothetical protein